MAGLSDPAEAGVLGTEAGVPGVEPGGPASQSAGAADDHDPWWAKRLDRAVEEIDEVFAELDRVRTPGCALGLTGPDGLELARGYGMASLEYRQPLDERSIFRMASVSKQFTAAVALLLERDGHLTLGDDIRDLLPDFPDYAERYGTPVTVRRLLHHTSGMRDYLTLMRLADRSDEFYGEGDVVEMLARQEELNFAPGARYMYSNSGYFLISQIVEEVTGLSMDEYATRELFEPLGMDRTHFHDDRARLVERRAIGHRRTRDGFALNETQLEMVGDGGLYTSVEDLARWERIFLADPEELPEGGARELAEYLGERILERGVLADGDTLDYAMGVRHGSYRGARTVGHGGSYVGFRTNVMRFPEHELSITVLCNLSQANPADLSRQVADILLGATLAPRAEEDGARAESGSGGAEAWDPDTAELSAFSGVYRSEELGVRYRIRAGTRRLFLEDPLALADSLRPGSEPGRFRGGPGTFRFVLDEDGEVRELRLDTGRARNIRFLPEDEDPESR